MMCHRVIDDTLLTLLGNMNVVLRRSERRKYLGTVWWRAKLLVVISTIALLHGVGARADGLPVSDVVTVAATISFGSEWLIHAQKDQHEFITTLRQQERPVRIDMAPRNRLFELIDSGSVDCILSATQTPIKNTFKAEHRIVFKVELFQHRNADLNRLPLARIGLLAHLPKPTVPLTAELEWYPLRSIEQGVDLLAERRLDVIIADRTRIAMVGNKRIVSSGLPAVRMSKLALICRDTKSLRDFVDGFDRSFRLPKNASGVSKFQPKGFTG